jgi:exopolysaccharide production protein ExoY
MARRGTKTTSPRWGRDLTAPGAQMDASSNSSRRAGGMVPQASPYLARQTGARLCVKRTLDITIGLTLLLLTLPLLVVIAAAVAASGGTIFYGHPRIGRSGREFRCWKFRTMHRGADAALANILANDVAARAEWAARRKLERDPRVTRLGRLLRKLSLDELPQIANVLIGDMSLVGPRPVTEEELETYYVSEPNAYTTYLSLRPGITGLWQVSGRSGSSYRMRISFDLEYARSLSIRRDLVILVLTCVKVLLGAGAL